MVFHRRVLPVVALAVLAAAAVGGTARAAATSPKASRLVSFPNCPALLTYAKAHATPYIGPYGFGRPVAVSVAGKATPGILAPTAAAAATSSGATSNATAATTPTEGVDYSGTNNQEAGVDEPDIVKTDGKTLFAIANSNQLNAVDVSGATPKLLDTITLNTGWSNELLLYGTHLLVLSHGGYWLNPLPAMPAQVMPISPSDSVITEIDVSDPTAMKVVNTLTLDGSYDDARMIGSTVRIVSSSQMPIELPFATPAVSTSAGLAATKSANKKVVATSKVASWLPSYHLRSGPAHPLVSCRDVRRPVSFSGLGMTTVLTIDLSQGLTPVNSTAVMSDSGIVYASQSSLYIATENWASRPNPITPYDAPQSVTTTINKFDISNPATTVYMGSGTVPGYLLDQFSMSEFQGVLRVVSTDAPAWWSSSGSSSQSYLTTLTQGSGALVQDGQVGGLGQGERVYAVRFDDNAGYVVTFRQVDPLYTLDLTDPSNPTIAGQLDLPGYSAYLHPLGDGLLLGVGEDVDPTTNEPTGTQVSLFDVSDLKNPKLLFKDSLGQGWSPVESDHHAFLYWAPTNLVVVPFGQQAVAMKVSRTAGITELGRIVQTDADSAELPTINRSVVVGSSLLTISDSGVKANGLTSLANIGWAGFPSPTPVTITGPVPLPTPVVPGVAAASTVKR